MPKDDYLSRPHKPAGVKVHLGPGFRMKDGKVEKIENYGLDTSAKIRKKKSKRVKPVKRTP